MPKGKRSENLIVLRCEACKNRGYYTSKNKKKVERKIELMKFCRRCRKQTKHKETKISGK